MRDAPSVPILHRLAEDGAVLRAYDPAGMDQGGGSCCRPV